MQLFAVGARVGETLNARRETVAVAESAAGGLISAALLAVPGASAFYLGGAVVYTPRAPGIGCWGLRREDVRGYMSATEPFALLMAETHPQAAQRHLGHRRNARRGRTATLWPRRRARRGGGEWPQPSSAHHRDRI